MTGSGAWKPVPPGVCQGPDVGGDIQAGDSWDIRFWRDDRRRAVVTVWIYPVQYDDRPGYRVQVQTEITICTNRADPGNTERWADAFYYDRPAVHEKLSEAEDAARELAGQYAAGRVHVTSWDGLSLSTPAADMRRGLPTVTRSERNNQPS